MTKFFFLILLLSLVPMSASLRANTVDSEISNHSGFPTTVREAGECFFGNYRALVASLQENILVNQYRIKIIRRYQDSVSDTKQILPLQNSARSANVLTKTNVALASQLTQLKGKCSLFPKWD